MRWAGFAAESLRNSVVAYVVSPIAAFSGVTKRGSRYPVVRPGPGKTVQVKLVYEDESAMIHQPAITHADVH